MAMVLYLQLQFPPCGPLLQLSFCFFPLSFRRTVAITPLECVIYCSHCSGLRGQPHIPYFLVKFQFLFSLDPAAWHAGS